MHAWGSLLASSLIQLVGPTSGWGYGVVGAAAHLDFCGHTRPEELQLCPERHTCNTQVGLEHSGSGCGSFHCKRRPSNTRSSPSCTKVLLHLQMGVPSGGCEEGHGQLHEGLLVGVPAGDVPNHLPELPAQCPLLQTDKGCVGAKLIFHFWR